MSQQIGCTVSHQPMRIEYAELRYDMAADPRDHEVITAFSADAIHPARIAAQSRGKGRKCPNPGLVFCR